MKEKGITLVALVITIVLMITLVSVSVVTVLDGKLFGYAGKATSKVELYSIVEALNEKGVMYGKENLNGTLSEVLGNGYRKYDGIFRVVNGELVYTGEDTKIIENLFELGLEESAIENTSAICSLRGHDFIPANYLNPKTCKRCGYVEGTKLAATVPHEDQNSENTDIGIGTDGQLVNLDNWTYTKVSGTWKLTGYTGPYSDPGGEIEGKVPQVINNINVTSMQDTFKNNTNLKVAPQIPTTVTSMNSTFRGCTALTTAAIMPYGVKDANWAYCGCSSLAALPDDFTLPDSITGRYIISTLAGCSNLEELPDGFRIPSNSTTVNCLFEGCTKLKKLPDGFTIPNTVTELDKIFKDCRALEELPDSFRLPQNNKNTCSSFFWNCSSLKQLPTNFTIPEGCTTIAGMFCGCSSLEGLPENFRISSTVQTIYQMFQQCTKLKSLPSGFAIPNSVTNITYAFYGCSNLVNIPTDLIIPESVDSFYWTFNGCTKIEGSIIIDGAPSNVDGCLGRAVTSGNGLVVKYTSKCTNIDSIRATISSGANITFEQTTLPTATN